MDICCRMRKRMRVLYQICFSPTGSTKRVADILCRTWEDHWTEVDLSKKLEQEAPVECPSGELCLVAVPSFAGRVPEIAARRIRHINGNGARAVLVCVYGNRAYDDTLLELQDLLTGCGFQPVAAIAAVAEHSIIRSFGAGRPDDADRLELERFAGKIALLPPDVSQTMELRVPGNRPYREHKGGSLIPKAGHRCTGCIACATLCPVGAIDIHSPADTDKDVCISCMRCVAVCPQQARSVDPLLKFALEKRLKGACSARKENELFLAKAQKEETSR